MPSAPARIGIIGCGVIGRMHARFNAEAAHIDLVAIADMREDAAKAVAEEFGVGTVYTSAEELLADDRIQGVTLAMPTCHRFELGLQVLRAGKHLLTEKPVALNADEVRQLIAARGDLLAGCCSSRHRFLESAKAATEIVASGALGDLRLIRARGISAAGIAPAKTPPPWRVSRKLNGGGIFVNWGCYDLDYLLGICGWQLKPTQVLANAWPIAPHLSARVAPGSDAESHVCALIQCERNVAIAIDRGEATAAQADGAWEIIGTEGSLTLKLTPGEGNQIVQTTTTAEGGAESKVVWEGTDQWDDVHRGVAYDFGQAIQDGRQPATSLENALVIQQITDAVYASSDSGQLATIH